METPPAEVDPSSLENEARKSDRARRTGELLGLEEAPAFLEDVAEFDPDAAQDLAEVRTTAIDRTGRNRQVALELAREFGWNSGMEQALLITIFEPVQATARLEGIVRELLIAGTDANELDAAYRLRRISYERYYLPLRLKKDFDHVLRPSGFSWAQSVLFVRLLGVDSPDDYFEWLLDRMTEALWASFATAACTATGFVGPRSLAQFAFDQLYSELPELGLEARTYILTHGNELLLDENGSTIWPADQWYDAVQ